MSGSDNGNVVLFMFMLVYCLIERAGLSSFGEIPLPHVFIYHLAVLAPSDGILYGYLVPHERVDAVWPFALRDVRLLALRPVQLLLGRVESIVT